MFENHTPKFVTTKKRKDAEREDKNTVDNFICFIKTFPINTVNSIDP